MDDTVYRQEAIDAAIEAAYKWDGCNSVERAHIIADDLKALSSAQPEITKIKATWYCGERCLICPVCGEDRNSEDANFCYRCGQFLKAWDVEDEDG